MHIEYSRTMAVVARACDNLQRLQVTDGKARLSLQARSFPMPLWRHTHAASNHRRNLRPEIFLKFFSVYKRAPLLPVIFFLSKHIFHHHLRSLIIFSELNQFFNLNTAKMFGAPRGSSCFKCGQQGHVAAACPAEAPTCYNCGLSGHLSRECPQPKNKACYTCGQEGHLSSACPQGPGAGGFGGASGGGECYRCGKPGHIARMCPESGDAAAGGFGGAGGYGGYGGGAGFGNKSCYTCGGVGHISRECPSGASRGFGGGFGGPRKCYNCGQDGHISRECPQEQGKTCYSCGQPGHIASACPGTGAEAPAA